MKLSFFCGLGVPLFVCFKFLTTASWFIWLIWSLCNRLWLNSSTWYIFKLHLPGRKLNISHYFWKLLVDLSLGLEHVIGSGVRNIWTENPKIWPFAWTDFLKCTGNFLENLFPNEPNYFHRDGTVITVYGEFKIK